MQPSPSPYPLKRVLASLSLFLHQLDEKSSAISLTAIYQVHVMQNKRREWGIEIRARVEKKGCIGLGYWKTPDIDGGVGLRLFKEFANKSIKSTWVVWRRLLKEEKK